MILAIDLNPVDGVIGGIDDLIGSAAEAAGEAILELVVAFVFGLVADAAAAVTEAIIAAMTSTTAVDLDGGFFPELTPLRQTVMGMSIALVLAFFLASIVRALAAGEPGAIIRAALVDVPAAIMTMLLSVTIAWILLRIVDEASLGVTGDVGAAMGGLSASLVAVDLLTTSGLLGLIFGLLFIIGAILVWLQLLVRSALIYVLIVMAPLGFATRAHPGTRQIARRTIEMGVALILSKFAVAVAFGVGATAISSSNGIPEGEGVALRGMMAGVAVMLMAAFMPWVILKAIPFVESATAAAGVERAPMRSAVAAASMAAAAGVGISKLAGSGGGGAAGGSAGGGGSQAGPSGGSSPSDSIVGAMNPPGGGGPQESKSSGAGSGQGGNTSVMTAASPQAPTVSVSPEPPPPSATPLGGSEDR